MSSAGRVTSRKAIRPVDPMQFPDVEPNAIETVPPTYIDVDPRTLLVDESYQRNLSERSIAIIRRILAGWDWRAFKPPSVVAGDGGYHVIDGQHTAIAAASHPAIETIPVQIVVAEAREDRAGAFVKLNRDRIAVTAVQLHHALVAAGDEDAATIEQVCRRAGARIVRQSPGQVRYEVGDIFGIATLRAIISRRHAAGARRVLDVCVAAKCAPISMAVMRAVEMLLFEQEYAGTVTGEDLATTLRSLGDQAERDARLFAAEHRVPIWRGLATVLYRKTRKVRRGS